MKGDGGRHVKVAVLFRPCLVSHCSSFKRLRSIRHSLEAPGYRQSSDPARSNRRTNRESFAMHLGIVHAMLAVNYPSLVQNVVSTCNRKILERKCWESRLHQHRAQIAPASFELMCAARADHVSCPCRLGMSPQFSPLRQPTTMWWEGLCLVRLRVVVTSADFGEVTQLWLVTHLRRLPLRLSP
jgi:hypothetical protein